MADPGRTRRLPPSAQRMLREVGERQTQIERGRRGKKAIWRSIAVLGTVGWSVALPTVLGVVLGVWLDGVLPVRFSWTLTLLILGLAIGCANAWLQIKKEQQ
jgi:ATP synthase protein I